MVTSSGPPSSPRVHVYITLRPRLALIERKLMKPILRHNKFVQPVVSIGYIRGIREIRVPRGIHLARKNASYSHTKFHIALAAL